MCCSPSQHLHSYVTRDIYRHVSLVMYNKVLLHISIYIIFYSNRKVVLKYFSFFKVFGKRFDGTNFI